MAILTPAQIITFARQAGWPAPFDETITAIALRESAGDPNAFNGNITTGDRSYGLTQINLLDKGINKVINDNILKGRPEKDLCDPLLNLQAGFFLSGGPTAPHAQRLQNIKILWYIDKPIYKERWQDHIVAAHEAALGLV